MFAYIITSLPFYELQYFSQTRSHATIKATDFGCALHGNMQENIWCTVHDKEPSSYEQSETFFNDLGSLIFVPNFME
jgi:hypothetical protein